MSERFKSRTELIGKIDWEGGILESLDYGVHADSMPDVELEQAWAAMEVKYRELEGLLAVVRGLLGYEESGW